MLRHWRIRPCCLMPRAVKLACDCPWRRSNCLVPRVGGKTSFTTDGRGIINCRSWLIWGLSLWSRMMWGPVRRCWAIIPTDNWPLEWSGLNLRVIILSRVQIAAVKMQALQCCQDAWPLVTSTHGVSARECSKLCTIPAGSKVDN